MKKALSFDFVSGLVDKNTDKVIFNYRVNFDDQSKIDFSESLTFERGTFVQTKIPNELLSSLVFNLHLISGISYWKLYCPPKIIISTRSLSKLQAEFWNTVYKKGLGEFFFKNKVDYGELINFPYDKKAKLRHSTYEPTTRVSLSNRSLIGIGGGKDSILITEILKQSGKPVTGLIIETQRQFETITAVVDQLGIDYFKVRRHLDEKLWQGDHLKLAYNGLHIPISAVYAFIGTMMAALNDYKYFIVANEKSANVGNIDYLGEIINHQWSKSEEFEKLFQNYIAEFISPDLVYFSALRPLHEIKTVQLFSRYHKYFSLFSSCNRNFRVDGPSKKSWCGQCPKCAFVFLMMAVFLPKQELVQIFGKNLFTDNLLINLYEELLGLGKIKPFDCVGTVEETQAAFYLIYKKNQFNETPVMRMFTEKVLPVLKNPEKLVSQVLTPDYSSKLPDEFKEILKKAYEN